MEMYNILFVDDEPSVVKGLAYDIDWNDIGITNVFKAYSVQQALELLEKTRVDIVVTDICMPSADGMELAKVIKDRWPFSVVIFLSGHDEFGFAQKAIELGVFSYITKPLDYGEFRNIVKNAVAKLEEALNKEKVIQQAEKGLEGIRPILQERYLKAWIVRGVERPEENYDGLLSYGLEFHGEDYVFLSIIRIDGGRNQINTQEEGIFQLALKELVRQWLFKGQDIIFFKDDEKSYVVLYRSGSREDCMRRFAFVQEVAEPFLESVRRSLGCIVSIFLGEVGHIEDAPKIYINTDDRMHRLVSNAPGMIMLPERTPGAGKPGVFEALYAKPDLGALLETRDHGKALQKINRIFDEIEKEKTIERSCLLVVYNAISGALIHSSVRNGIDISQWAKEDEGILYNFELVHTVVELRNWCLGVVSKFLEHLKGVEKKHSNHLVGNAKRIIDENLSQEISVAEIASYLYLHPNYLTRLFKAETGMSLMDYISKKRVEQAKVFLCQPGFKVYEVAQRVGYESIAHFNKIFKRDTGMSPKEYQTKAMMEAPMTFD